jgi:hypothetical protein
MTYRPFSNFATELNKRGSLTSHFAQVFTSLYLPYGTDVKYVNGGGLANRPSATIWTTSTGRSRTRHRRAVDAADESGTARGGSAHKRRSTRWPSRLGHGVGGPAAGFRQAALNGRQDESVLHDRLYVVVQPVGCWARGKHIFRCQRTSTMVPFFVVSNRSDHGRHTASRLSLPCVGECSGGPRRRSRCGPPPASAQTTRCRPTLRRTGRNGHSRPSVPARLSARTAVR